MADLAEEGDVKAARLILDKFMSSGATQEESDGHEAARGITIRIENATFAKAPPTIDADFNEVSTKVEPTKEINNG
jgi:hypothetical protein